MAAPARWGISATFHDRLYLPRKAGRSSAPRRKPGARRDDIVKLDSIAAIVRAFEDAGVRYLVVGGLAVAAYGYLRFTKDLDVVLELVPDNVHAMFEALSKLGYRPLVPVTGEQFADAAERERLIVEKSMTVLNFQSDSHRDTPIDVFVTEPFDFHAEYARATLEPFAGTGGVPFVALPTLIRMKEAANRPQARIDVDELSHRLDDISAPSERDDDWSLATWTGSRRAQLRRWSELSLEDVIGALEEMQDLAAALGPAPGPLRRSPHHPRQEP